MLLLVSGVSLFVERELAGQAVVKLLNHYIPLTTDQDSGIEATIREWLNVRGQISLAALPLLLWGALKFLRTLIRTANRVWHAKAYSLE